jgi:class 3 adenylate cyclase
MVGTARRRIYLRRLTAVLVVAGVITPVFNVLTSEPSVRSALQGLVDVGIIGGLVTGYLGPVREDWLRVWFRRLGFWTDMMLSRSVVLALFLVGRALGQVVMTGDPRRLVMSFTDAHLLYALPYFVILSVGHPGEFQAEPNARRECLALLRRRGVSPTDAEGTHLPLRRPRGFHPARRGANCVRCFFGIRAVIERDAAAYGRDFGLVPRFREGLHGGAVTTGELGYLRQQIVVVGYILNTTARLEEYAKRTNLDLVASGPLLERIELPPDVEARSCGTLTIRGKETHVLAYSLSEAREAVKTAPSAPAEPK